MVLHTEYLVGAKGQKKSIVLSIRDFRKLMNYLEDLEDALDLKKAKRFEKNFIDFDEYLQKIKKT